MLYPYGRYEPVVEGAQAPKKHHTHILNVIAHLPAPTSLNAYEPPSAVEGGSDSPAHFWKHWRPALPVLLIVSTILGGLCMIVLQIPKLCGLTAIPQAEVSIAMAALYLFVLTCIIYTAFADPGTTEAQDLPARAWKDCLYRSPVLRFDRHDEWLQNVIGLYNHREFVLMLAGLTLIATMGIIADVWILLVAESGIDWRVFLIILHLLYSLVLLVKSGRSFIFHAGLISRSELTRDFIRKHYHVENDVEEGICDDIFSSNNSLVYESSSNPFDKGCFTNCWNFWCQPRWCADAKGDF